MRKLSSFGTFFLFFSFVTLFSRNIIQYIHRKYVLISQNHLPDSLSKCISWKLASSLCLKWPLNINLYYIRIQQALFVHEFQFVSFFRWIGHPFTMLLWMKIRILHTFVVFWRSIIVIGCKIDGNMSMAIPFFLPSTTNWQYLCKFQWKSEFLLKLYRKIN